MHPSEAASCRGAAFLRGHLARRVLKLVTLAQGPPPGVRPDPDAEPVIGAAAASGAGQYGVPAGAAAAAAAGRLQPASPRKCNCLLGA